MDWKTRRLPFVCVCVLHVLVLCKQSFVRRSGPDFQKSMTTLGPRRNRLEFEHPRTREGLPVGQSLATHTVTRLA